MGMPGGTPTHDHTHRQASLAFDEYKLVAEDTARISDRRQTVNTLFVSINALFLTGVGYLLYKYGQSYGDGLHLTFFTAGFLVIAVLTRMINRSWLRLSDQYSKLINLRIRYLEKLEAFLRDTGYFPTFEVPLKGMDPVADADYEAPPLAMNSAVTTHTSAAAETEFKKLVDASAANMALKKYGDVKPPQPQRWMDTRGTYTLEEVLYNNPKPGFKVFGFTKAEQQVVRAFGVAYWLAFWASLAGIVVLLATALIESYLHTGAIQF